MIMKMVPTHIGANAVKVDYTIGGSEGAGTSLIEISFTGSPAMVVYLVWKAGTSATLSLVKVAADGSETVLTSGAPPSSYSLVDGGIGVELDHGEKLRVKADSSLSAEAGKTVSVVVLGTLIYEA